jgi:hypothetical protein
MFLLTLRLALSGFPPSHVSLLVSDKNVPCSSNCNMHLLDVCRLAMCPLLSHCQIVFISHAGFRNCLRVSMLSIFNPSGSTEIASQNKSQLLPPCPHTHFLIYVAIKRTSCLLFYEIMGTFSFMLKYKSVNDYDSVLSGIRTQRFPRNLRPPSLEKFSIRMFTAKKTSNLLGRYESNCDCIVYASSRRLYRSK